MRLIRSFALTCVFVFAACASAHAQRDGWFTTSDGVRLHYLEAGQGQTLVFIPGWTMPAWIFSQQIAAFSQHYHVVALDPRAQGDSDVAPSGYNQDRRGQDIAELLDRLGPQPVVLVGWSLGVLDTLAYVHTHGDTRLAGLVLVDNSVGEDPPPTPSHAPSVARRGRPPSREATMHAFVAGMFDRPHPISFIDELTEACLRTPPLAARELLSYPVPRTYWKEAVYATGRPILYIVRPHLAGQAANLAAHDPNAETVVVSDVGHAMFVDDPTGFDNLLQSFLTHRVWH